MAGGPTFTKSNDGDPYTNFNFAVHFGSTKIAGFTRVTGMEMSLEVMSYSQGGVNDRRQLLRGDPSFGNVTLHRGLTKNTDFIDWTTDASTGKQSDVKKTVSITSYDNRGTATWKWTLNDARPIETTGPSLRGDGGYGITQLELAYQSLDVTRL